MQLVPKLILYWHAVEPQYTETHYNEVPGVMNNTEATQGFGEQGNVMIIYFNGTKSIAVIN